jgi:hypothetical protein
MLAATGCGGGSTAGSTATTASQTAPPYVLSLDRAELEAHKTYTTHRFTPTLRFTLGGGSWMVENRESPTDFSIALEMPSTLAATIGWHRVTRVFDPVKGGVLPRDLVPFHGDFANWLTHHPRLRTSTPERVTIAGLTGVRVDVTSKSQPPRVPRDCGKAGPRCVPVFYDGQDTLTYARGDRGRLTVLALPEGGQLVMEEFASPGARFPRLLGATRSTLDSVELVG